MIGSFGPVIFIATAETLRTFDEFVRSTAARWSVHEIHLKHPMPEYIGPGQDSISFVMHFDAKFGVNPRKEINQLLELARSGEAQKLIVGGSALGVNKWYVESAKQYWGAIDNNGIVMTGRVEVALKEYI